MTHNALSLAKEQELFVASTDSFLEVTVGPLHSCFAQAHSFAAELGGKHSAMPFSPSGVLQLGGAGGSWL